MFSYVIYFEPTIYKIMDLRTQYNPVFRGKAFQAGCNIDRLPQCQVIIDNHQSCMYTDPNIYFGFTS